MSLDPFGLEVVSGPAAEPVSRPEMKLHLRVEHDADDALVDALIVAARQVTEAMCGRAWVARSLRLRLDGWPCLPGRGPAIELPVSPVQSVDSLKYRESSAGTLTTLAANTDYVAWLDRVPPLITPAPAASWPSTRAGYPGAVEAEFTAGYGSPSAVPEDAKAAMKLCVGWWYENRGDDPRAAGVALPAGVAALLRSVSARPYL